jgi:hypothetical protein
LTKKLFEPLENCELRNEIQHQIPTHVWFHLVQPNLVS